MYVDSSYAAVENLPWMYSTRTLELSFRRDPAIIDAGLPRGVVSEDGECAASFVSATSGSPNSPDRARHHPELGVYGEFLYKVAVQYRGKSWWFIPLSIVSHDFSLLRGHFMGFPKRIGHVTTSSPEVVHPELLKLLPADRVTARASLPGTLDASGTLSRQDMPARERTPRSFLLQVVNPITGQVQLCTPITSFYETRPLFEGLGSLSIVTTREDDPMACRHEGIAGRLYLDAVTIDGVEPL